MEDLKRLVDEQERRIIRLEKFVKELVEFNVVGNQWGTDHVTLTFRNPQEAQRFQEMVEAAGNVVLVRKVRG